MNKLSQNSLLAFDNVLDRLDGSVEILRQQIAFLLEDVPGHLVLLEEHAARGNMREAERLAHLVAGSMLSIDADPAVELARRLEAACHEGNRPQAANLAAQLRLEVQGILDALATWMDRHPAAAS
jgi:HPt (histidine-containing phosphotransfer) domain-containing protein